MNCEDAVAKLKLALGERLTDFKQPSQTRVYIEVDAQTIPDVTQILTDDLKARFQTASGVDAPVKMEILYHWAIDSCGLVVSVRTRIDRERPEIASIATICPAAEWIEREMWELLGISFPGHPDLRHLVLLDDWPEGNYPLRRGNKKD